jgi:hypothetical protein
MNMLKPLTLLSLTALSLVASAAPNMEEGNWEVTTKMEMEGMPFAMPASKHNQCMTKKDAIPDTSQKNQDCKMLDQNMSGDTVSWKVQCKGKDGTVDGDGKITYSGKTYDGVMQAKMTSPKGEVNVMKMSFQGKHTGACKSKPGKRADDY